MTSQEDEEKGVVELGDDDNDEADKDDNNDDEDEYDDADDGNKDDEVATETVGRVERSKAETKMFLVTFDKTFLVIFGETEKVLALFRK